MSTLRVRPYTRTGGRTRSTTALAIEAIVTTNDRADRDALTSTAEHRAIGDLCRLPHSVAEVAARLSLPLGVVRVLLSDMSDLALINVHEGEDSPDGGPSLALMERVLLGLRRI
ncbi:hypothetical protein GCM10022243_22690 [Saccharothrix violaceirubra]|uniref:DUF742 domain-containing protein n=1 Tax=Saccharothrix violaceirubra TaxID=413306 RepID=UPI001613F081|nr:DUF742 domain-containing protein [Saccharothrix violaceirubra]